MNQFYHIEHLPTGEQFLEQRDYWHTPYRFNGKELDEETGYYYYGARYYTPELGIWLSVDPLSDKYPSMSAFMYCAGNPVVLVDPDGRKIKPTNFGDNEVADYYASFVGGSDEMAELVFAIKPDANSGTYGTRNFFKNIDEFRKNANKKGAKLKGNDLKKAYNAYSALLDQNVIEIQGIKADYKEESTTLSAGRYQSGTSQGNESLLTRNDNLIGLDINTKSETQINDSFENSKADIKGSGFMFFKDKTPSNGQSHAKGVLYINVGSYNHQDNLNKGLNKAFEQIYGN
jgi:RHS repeat-associated protein